MDAGPSSVGSSSTLDRQIVDSDALVADFQEKILCGLELMMTLKSQRDELRSDLQRERQLRYEFQKERDKLQTERDDLRNERDRMQREQEELRNKLNELQIERDRAATGAEQMRRKRSDGEEGTSSEERWQFSEITSTEIERATANFDPSKKISEGVNGRSVYRGQLRNTQVAIKISGFDNLQNRTEFHREVEVLSRVRHPNIVSLIGVCPENYLLVYEYLPSGTLEDRLNCKDDTSPLSWQIRTRIAAEICSAIIFLHSNHPYRIVHGNLRPENVLLDENLVSKLCGFGNSGLIPREGVSPRTSTPCRRIDPIVRAYVDPEFVETQELTPASDVYSFGVILLLLLTGGPAMGIVQTVKSALNNGTLDKMLDESAGSWPLEQAKQLIYWALKCCEEIRQRRPDLELITITLERLKQGSCGASSSSSRPISESEPRETPSHFLCPIFQETMRDPRMAADGYTYEYAAIREWLDRGHDTSPMTNLPLIHQELTPNLTLRSAIQEWLDY